MSEPRVIQATFSDWRTVKGRKVLQLIMEVRLEDQGEVLKMLGPPDSVGSKWCAIALLDMERAANGSAAEGHASAADAMADPAPRSGSGSRPERSATQRRKFTDMSLPEQCGTRCSDYRFERFLLDEYASTMDAFENDVAQAVRHLLCVKSRAELSTSHDAANKWRNLDAEYQRWLTDEEYADVRR